MTDVECFLWSRCREYEKACGDCGHNALLKSSFHVPVKPVGFLILKSEDAQHFEGIDRAMYQPAKT
jgi:hypothetical protein